MNIHNSLPHLPAIERGSKLASGSPENIVCYQSCHPLARPCGLEMRGLALNREIFSHCRERGGRRRDQEQAAERVNLFLRSDVSINFGYRCLWGTLFQDLSFQDMVLWVLRLEGRDIRVQKTEVTRWRVDLDWFRSNWLAYDAMRTAFTHEAISTLRIRTTKQGFPSQNNVPGCHPSELNVRVSWSRKNTSIKGCTLDPHLLYNTITPLIISN